MEVPDLLLEDELPPATDGLDAWGGAHPGATGAQGRLALAGADVGKLAVQEQAVRVRDVLRLRPELRLALREAPAWAAALCRPGVARSGAQSYAAREVAKRRVRTQEQDAAGPQALAEWRKQKSKVLLKKLSQEARLTAASPQPDVQRPAKRRPERRARVVPRVRSRRAVMALQATELAMLRAG